MALLHRKTRPPADVARDDDPASPATAPYTSQAFELWDRESRPGGKRCVLDMGSASAANVSHFSAEPCRIEVAGLSACVPTPAVEAGDDDDPDHLEASALRALLPELPPRSQHGALCWDVANYLTRPQFAVLGEWLAEIMTLDGVVLVSLYTGSTMPARPCSFGIAGEGQLLRLDQGSGRADCPRYSQGDLKRDWPEFEVVRSYLLRAEAQEFVLRRV